MTRNQIAYWEYRERARSNLANERENARANRAREIETNRSNLANETETNRSNVARETETNRHNLITEVLEQGKLNETVRHNQTVETETNRSNLANEALKGRELSERERSNRANEAIGWGNVSLGYANLAEVTRSNKVREAETERLNTANISIGNRNALSNAQQAEGRVRNAAAAERNAAVNESRVQSQNYRDFMTGSSGFVNSLTNLNNAWNRQSPNVNTPATGRSYQGTSGSPSVDLIIGAGLGNRGLGGLIGGGSGYPLLPMNP